MSREYKHIQEYSKEIENLKERGLSHRQIGEKLGFSKTQVRGYYARKYKKERKIAAGIAIKKKGRPAKDREATKEDSLTELRYKLARQDARIRQLEMANELMRDFLSLTERK